MDIRQVWSLVRCSGRWAFPLFNLQCFPDLLEACPLCHESNVRVDHLLLSCSGCIHLRAQIPSEFLQRSPLTYLFADRPGPCDPHIPDPRVEYVASALALAAAAYSALGDFEHISDLLEEVQRAM